jgi:hypothetical protein
MKQSINTCQCKGKGRIGLALNDASTRERVISLRNLENDIKPCDNKQHCTLIGIWFC